MTLLCLLTALSASAVAVSAGYGGRGVIPSAEDLAAAGVPGAGPSVVPGGGAAHGFATKGVIPRPRPIVFPDTSGVIDPGFAPRPWNTPGLTPGGRPITGTGGARPGGFPAGGGYATGGYRGYGSYGGKPIGGGYRGGSFNYNPIGGNVGPIAGGGADGIGPVSGGGTGLKPLDGTDIVVGGKPISGIGGAVGKETFGGVHGIADKPVIEPVGAALEPIGDADIRGKPLDVPLGSAGHGGVQESFGGVDGSEVPGKPVVAPIGSEFAGGLSGSDGVVVESGVGTIDGGFGGKPLVGPTGIGGKPVVGPSGSGLGPAVVDGLGPAGGTYGGVVEGQPGVVPFGIGGGSGGVGTGPVDGDLVGVKPGKVPISGSTGGIGSLPGVSYGGGGGFVGPIGGKPGLQPIASGGGTTGIGHVSGGSFGVGPVAAGPAVGPAFEPGVGPNVKVGLVPADVGGDTGFAGVGPVGAGGIESLEGTDLGVSGGGIGVDSVEAGPALVPIDGVAVEDAKAVSGGGVYGGGGAFNPSGDAFVVPESNFGGTGLTGTHGFHSGGTGLKPTDIDVSGVLGPVGGGAGIEPVAGIVPVDDGSLGVVPVRGADIDGGLPVGGIAPAVVDKETGGALSGVPVGGTVVSGFGGGVKPGGHVPSFGAGGHKPFLPVTGDRAVGEVHPGFGPVGSIDQATGGTEFAGTLPAEKPVIGGVGTLPVEKPVGGYYGAAWPNSKPYKPPRGYYGR